MTIIEVESNGQNIISQNTNGTKDYGLMQVNSIHTPTPYKLLDPEYNIRKGVQYIRYCVDAAKSKYPFPTIRDVARMYNQGINGDPKDYKNWWYVEKVTSKFLTVYARYGAEWNL